MAGSIQGWAVMAGGKEEGGDFTYEDVEEGLSLAGGSGDTKKLRETFEVLGSKGEFSAEEVGYIELVAEFLNYPSVEVNAAAIDALGKMGNAGLLYAEQISQCLEHQDKEVQTAAATALGNFGRQASAYTPKLLRVATEVQDETAKSAAIVALGQVGAEEEADKLGEMLKSSSALISGAACKALGLLGAAGQSKAGSQIAAKLTDQKIKYMALCALKDMGASAVKESIDTIISQCLTDKDLATREMACIALGTAAEEVLSSDSNMDKITNLLDSQEPGIRCAAALALGRVGGKALEKLGPKLEAFLNDESEDLSWRSLQIGGGAPAVMRKPKCAALSALGMMGASKYAPEIVTTLISADYEVRLCALQSLAGMGEAVQSHSGDVASSLEDDVYLIRAEACKTLAAMEAEDSVDSIAALLEDSSPSVCIAAAKALSQLATSGEISNKVFKLLKSPTKSVRAAAIDALGNMGEIGECYAGPIATFLTSDSLQVRLASIEALGKLGTRGAAFADEVAEFLQDASPSTRRCAAKCLGKMGPDSEQFLPESKALLQDPFVSEVAKPGEPSAPLVDGDVMIDGASVGLGVLPERYQRVALETWKVVHNRVAKRAKPDKDSKMLAAAKKDEIVQGTVIEVDGVQWLKMKTATSESKDTQIEAYMMIDGKSVGLGVLLEKQ